MSRSNLPNYEHYEPEAILEIKDGRGMVKAKKPVEQKRAKTKPPPKHSVGKQSSYSVPLSDGVISEMHEVVKKWSGPVGGGNPTIRAFIQEAIAEKIAKQKGPQ